MPTCFPMVVTMSHQTVHYQHCGGWQRSRSDLPHGGSLQSDHDLQRQPSQQVSYFRDLNDRTLPDHLHDEVHEDYDISECTMVKSYRFARYLQHFNKLQTECKKKPRPPI
ncbi:hypothetical protein TNCV_3598191 [Trichonephila clavipes]|nr:hypothetical protein TNCV_3598191 [Trichonephila clavipes]